MSAAAPAFVDEATAREVVMLQAYETCDEALPQWSAEDRAWATRAARETTPDASARPLRFVAERARHAMHRLRAREAELDAWLRPSSARRVGGVSRAGWCAVAVALAFAAGLLADHIGPSQRVDILSFPVWALVAWNAAVGVFTLVAWRPRRAPARRGLRRWLVARLEPTAGGSAPLRRFAAAWFPLALPLNLQRAALVLHLAAAALAAGVVAGMYLRGLVLDYRAGWQSTFLEAGTVHAVLGVVLAPASALTGIALPDVDALAAQRVHPGATAQAPAAPWLHLLAATLLLFAIGPRLLLAAFAAWRVHRLARRWMLPLEAPYFRHLVRQAAQGPLVACIVPHAAPPAPSAALGLRSLLTPSDDTVDLRFAAPVAYGEEEEVGEAAPGCSLCIALFDFAATPEPEVHGRLLGALAARGLPLVAVADETSFVRRFGPASPRRGERRAAWQQLASTLGVGLVCANLEQPDAAANDLMRRALETVDGRGR